MNGKLSNKTLVAIAAVLLIIVGALGYALWRESQTETVRFEIGEGGIEVTGD